MGEDEALVHIDTCGICGTDEENQWLAILTFPVFSQVR
jgi:D-arabinose 1-dehydrogenase-like Zn-dependent alcohol dehydrogenase